MWSSQVEISLRTCLMAGPSCSRIAAEKTGWVCESSPALRGVGLPVPITRVEDLGFSLVRFLKLVLIRTEFLRSDMYRHLQPFDSC
mmetsp:Transcript_5619/g.16073  ORF Transcript_5619/g.16073 Transcript_5619/m.16073 type:complete len:86 (-) Transcript_5619:18-275(-)